MLDAGKRRHVHQGPWALAPGHSPEQRPLRSGTSLRWTEPPERPPPDTVTGALRPRLSQGWGWQVCVASSKDVAEVQRRERQALKGVQAPLLSRLAAASLGATREGWTEQLCSSGLAGSRGTSRTDSRARSSWPLRGSADPKESRPRLPPAGSPRTAGQRAEQNVRLFQASRLGVCSAVRETGTRSPFRATGLLDL